MPDFSQFIRGSALPSSGKTRLPADENKLRFSLDHRPSFFVI